MIFDTLTCELRAFLLSLRSGCDPSRMTISSSASHLKSVLLLPRLTTRLWIYIHTYSFVVVHFLYPPPTMLWRLSYSILSFPMRHYLLQHPYTHCPRPIASPIIFVLVLAYRPRPPHVVTYCPHTLCSLLDVPRTPTTRILSDCI